MARRELGPDRLIGLELGHYLIAEKVGEGRMGEVYRAHDAHLDREVAIKVLPPGTLSDESSRKRFRKEALALSKLNHPNVATIHDFDTQQGVDFLVMEYIPGITLSEKLAARPLPEKEILRLGMQLAEGLEAAHEHGVIHRDLKPGNLRLTDDGRLKILDFGLARLLAPASAEAETETQAVVGTVPYMSPEQLRGETVDARSDVWSAGAVLYEMATGNLPFQEKVTTATADAILHKVPATPRTQRKELSLGLEEIILKCLEKEPENRYQSAKELAVDLRRMTILGSTTQGPFSRRVGKTWAWKTVAGALVLGTLLAAGALSFRARRVQALTESDTIVLADFVNKTGDPVFDDTLKTALNISLRQSPFLNVLPDSKVVATLNLMTLGASTKLSPEVAHELCLRAGSKAYLVGSIASLGSQYVIAVKAVNCATGDLLAETQEQAAGKEEVLKALDKAAISLRTTLGESLSSVQKHGSPVEQATTTSLEALQAYSLAVKTMNEKGMAACIPFLKRAVELDPQFPMAYLGLSIAYSNLSRPSLALECARKAYQLRDRASGREKLRITANYFQTTGEVEKAAQAYEVWTETYPRDSIPHANLGSNYSYMGEYEKTLTEQLEALRLSPDSVVGYENVGTTYTNLNRLEEAKAVFDKALARKLDDGGLRGGMYILGFLRGDAKEMEQQLTWAAGKPGDEDPLLSLQSDTEAYYGRLRSARNFSRRAADSALRADSKETAALWLVNAALREAELCNHGLAREEVNSALALNPGWNVKVAAALTLARIGDAQRAKTLTHELQKTYPDKTMLKLYWLPTIFAAIELARNNSDKALAYLEAAAPYDLAGAGTFINYLYPAYVRGLAYLQERNGTAATAEFKKVLNHRGIVTNFVTGALAHLQIGRAYAMTGDKTKAQAAYQDFFTLWKDADPDIPILKQAKAEYTKL